MIIRNRRGACDALPPLNPKTEIHRDSKQIHIREVIDTPSILLPSPELHYNDYTRLKSVIHPPWTRRPDVLFADQSRRRERNLPGNMVDQPARFWEERCWA